MTTDKFKLSLPSTKHVDLEQLNLLEKEADEMLVRLKQFDSQSSPR